jgi:hypothetical protein
MNVKRVTTRNRLHLKGHVVPLIESAIEDGRIDPHECAAIREALDDSLAYATVIDIRDGLDRVTSPERLDPLLDEYRHWTERLPA